MQKVLFSLLTVLILASASGASLTVGNASPTNGVNTFPFGGSGFGPGTRYQQAYAASDFSSIGGPLTITGISFLLGGGTLSTSTYTLYLSTISSGIDTLSDVNFDSNRGPDNALFTSLALSGSGPSTLTFSGTPFTYDPGHGNLLLDIVVSPGGTGFTGAAYLSNTNAVGVFSRYHNFGTGNVGWGLVTKFDYVVPEPSATGMIATALLFAPFFRRIAAKLPITPRAPRACARVTWLAVESKTVNPRATAPARR
jgi:hypothetical protein